MIIKLVAEIRHVGLKWKLVPTCTLSRLSKISSENISIK